MAFSLTAMLGWNATQYQAGLRDAQRQAAQAGKSIGSAMSTAFSGPGGFVQAGAGALGLGSVFALGNKAMADYLSKLKEIKVGSASMGTDAETYQRLAANAEKWGVSIEKVDSTIDRLGVHADTLRKPVAEWGKAEMTLAKDLSALNISLESLLSKDATQVFLEWKAAIEQLGAAALETEGRSAAMKRTFGRGAFDLIPMLASRMGARLPAGAFSNAEMGTALQSQAAMVEAERGPKAAWHALGAKFSRGWSNLVSIPSALATIASRNEASDRDFLEIFAREPIDIVAERRLEQINAESATRGKTPKQIRAEAEAIQAKVAAEQFATMEAKRMVKERLQLDAEEADEAANFWEAVEGIRSDRKAKGIHVSPLDPLNKIGGFGSGTAGAESKLTGIEEHLRAIRRQLGSWTSP